MNRAAFTPPLLFALALSGCASTMSGVGGTENYACKAPEGALCTSVSGVYANWIHGAPTTAKPPEKKSPSAAPAIYGASSIAGGRPTNVSGTSIRSNPRLLRLWIAPWEDSDGDLHEEALVHVVVDTGRWLIEHVRPASRSRVDGVAPPVSSTQEPSAAKSPSELPQSPTHRPVAPAGLSSGSEPVPTER